MSQSQTLTTSQEPVMQPLSLLLERFALMMPSGLVWDREDQQEIKLSTFKLYVGRENFAAWSSHSQRSVITKSETSANRNEQLEKALARFVYLFPSSECWDLEQKTVILISDLRYAIASVFDDWLKSPQRKSIGKSNLIFDMTNTLDTTKYINSFVGFPLVPTYDFSKCIYIRQLARFLCNCSITGFDSAASEDDAENEVVYRWMMRWIAYPLQHAGAKMHTAILMQGEMHGSGKSLFWKIVSSLYGRYGRILNQAQLDSQYNEWVSGCAFAVFEEVIARSSRHDSVGMLKNMVTSDTIRIEEKYRSGREERNFMNCVFLGNSNDTFVLEEHDRRMLVNSPIGLAPKELIDGVRHEIDNGGLEAFYGFLLQYPLDDFSVASKPPINEAKQRLIDTCRSSWDAFFDDWRLSRLPIPFGACLVRDLYRFYVRWCHDNHEYCISLNKFSGYIGAKRGHGVRRQIDVHYDLKGHNTVTRQKGNFFIVGQPPVTVSGESSMTKAEWLGGCVAEFARIESRYATTHEATATSGAP